MEPTIFVAPILSALVVFAGSYMAFSKMVAILNTKVDELDRKVEKHNNLIERTYILERDVKTAFNDIDRMRDEIHEVRERI